ncbi:MAG: hypothetical protein ABMA14_11575 [Hyphomonadaceae bacterium]
MSGSAIDPHIIEIGRKQIEKTHLKHLTAALPGEDAATRAARILSLIADVPLMRQMIGLTPLAKTSPAALQKLLAPVIQQLIDGKS